MPRYVVYFTRSLAPFLQLASPYLFISFFKWIFRDLSCSQILKPEKYPFLNRSFYRQKDIDLYMDISPYLNMEEPTLKGCNQRKVLTLSTTLFSDDVPWAKGSLQRSGCETAIPPFPLKQGGPPSPPFRPIIDRDFTDAEGSLLTKPPSQSLERSAKLSTKLCFSPCSRNTRLVATLIQNKR